MKANNTIPHWAAKIFCFVLSVGLVVSTFVTVNPVRAAVPGADNNQASNDNNNYGPISVNINPVATAGIYDDTHAEWTYTGTWSALTGVTGPVGNSLHRGDVAGAKASLTFTGTQFILKYTQNTNRGNLTIKVDGNLVATLNQYGALQWQKTYISPIYSAGTHTVEFEHAGGGAYVDVDSIEILNITPASVGVYDNDDAGWAFTGTWTSLTSVTGPFDNSLHRGDVAGAKARFVFTGSQFIFKYTQNTNRGNIFVYLDGNLLTTINANGALQWQMSYTSPVFQPGTHVVEFEHAGTGAFVDIDSIEILNTALPGVGVYDNNHARWTYFGTWTPLINLTGPFGGGIHRGDVVGAKAAFTFTGTQFILKYTQNANRGNLSVYLDGNLLTTINENGALQWQTTYTSPTFSSAAHTVEFIHAGNGMYVDIDSIEILDSGSSSESDLTVNKTHSGSGFEQGETGKTFTITVTNSGGGGTVGQVTVVDTLPIELTATAISGTGWSCTLGNLTCTRSDSLDAGLSFNPINVTVTVANEITASSLTNEVAVSGGGETNTSNNTDSDEVPILKPDLVILSYELRNAANNAAITAPLPNEEFNIRMTVRNQGTAPTGLFYPGVFLDDEPNYGLDTVPFGRVSDWSGYRRTPLGALSGVGCIYYDPTNTINTSTTAVEAERGNYTRTQYNDSLDPGTEAIIDVYIGYPNSVTEYQDSQWDPYRTGLPAGAYSVYLYVDSNCSGGAMESNEDNAFGPVNFTVGNVSSEPGTGVYEDTDVNWVYTGAWSALTGVTGTSGTTLHRSSTVGDKATFTFNGSQFILKYLQNTNRGNMSVYLDGNLLTTINQNGTLQYQKTYTSPVFAPGVHTVEFRNAGGNTFADIDSLEILATAAPGVGLYENTNGNWTYTGAWTALTGVTGTSGTTLHRSSTVGDKATFTFSGSQFIFKYLQNTNRGNVSVYLDGNLLTTINGNGVLQYQKTYTSPIFAPGVHTVEFRNAGGNTYVDIDSLEILATAAPGTGLYENNNLNWIYTGGWTALTGVTGASGTTLHRSGTVGETASFTFSGTQFILKYTQNTNRGSVKVYVDNVLVTTFNENGSLVYQQTYTSPTFSAGTHTVRFENAGGSTYVDIDAIQIP